MQPFRLLLGARKLVALNSKRGNKNYYKGRGAPSIGTHTSRGGYKVDPARVASLVFVAPDLTDFKLKAYVSVATKHPSPYLIAKQDATAALAAVRAENRLAASRRKPTLTPVPAPAAAASAAASSTTPSQ